MTRFFLLVMLVFLLVVPLWAQSPSMGFSIKVIFPSIKIELNSALLYGKLYAIPLISPLVGSCMGEVKVWVEVKQELHTPDLLSTISKITKR